MNCSKISPPYSEGCSKTLNGPIKKIPIHVDLKTKQVFDMNDNLIGKITSFNKITGECKFEELKENGNKKNNNQGA